MSESASEPAPGAGRLPLATTRVSKGGVVLVSLAALVVGSIGATFGGTTMAFSVGRGFRRQTDGETTLAGGALIWVKNYLELGNHYQTGTSIQNERLC